jgi:hypothetical protein
LVLWNLQWRIVVREEHTEPFGKRRRGLPRCELKAKRLLRSLVSSVELRELHRKMGCILRKNARSTAKDAEVSV